MFSKVNKKMFALILAGVLLVGVPVGVFIARGQSQPPGPLPEGAVAIPADLIQKFEASITKLKAAQKEQANVEQIIRITLDRAGVAPEKFSEYRLDEEKKALVKVQK